MSATTIRRGHPAHPEDPRSATKSKATFSSSSTTIKASIAVVVVVAAACLYLLTPLRDVRSVDDLQALAAPVLDSPWLPLIVLGTYLVAGLVWLSVWLVVFQTCLLFPPTTAFPLAMAGALLSALMFFALGRVLGRDVVIKLAPPKVQAALSSVSLESMIAVRVLPILPFTLVNMCCGAFGVSLRTFVVGTLVGMAPGMLAVSILGHQVVELIKHPTPQAVAILVGVVAVLVTIAVVLRRRARRREHAAG